MSRIPGEDAPHPFRFDIWHVLCCSKSKRSTKARISWYQKQEESELQKWWFIKQQKLYDCWAWMWNFVHLCRCLGEEEQKRTTDIPPSLLILFPAQPGSLYSQSWWWLRKMSPWSEKIDNYIQKSVFSRYSSLESHGVERNEFTNSSFFIFCASPLLSSQVSLPVFLTIPPTSGAGVNGLWKVCGRPNAIICVSIAITTPIELRMRFRASNSPLGVSLTLSESIKPFGTWY